MRQFVNAAACTAIMFLFPMSASAQRAACDPVVEHAHLRTSIAACGVGGVDLSCACVCDAGYVTADGATPSATNPCVRPSGGYYGSYADPLCAYGATRGRDGECQCGTSTGARGVRTMAFVTREFANTIASHIEDFDQVRRHGRVVALQVCWNPLAGAGETPSTPTQIGWARDALNAVCGGVAADESDEDLVRRCAEAGELIRQARTSGDSTVTYEGNTYTFPQFVEQVFGPGITDLDRRVDDLEARLGEDDGRGPIAPRLAALEDRTSSTGTRGERGERGDRGERGERGEVGPPGAPAVPDGSNSFTLSIGGFGLLGFHNAGPQTGAGGLSLGLHFRPATAGLDVYARAGLGWQFTGYTVGDSPYLTLSAGVSVYLGATRRDTMLELGLWGENLWDPAADLPTDLQADSLGWSFGGQLGLSIPLHPYFRLVPGVAIGGGERRYLANSAMVVLNGIVVEPTVRLEGLLPSF